MATMRQRGLCAVLVGAFKRHSYNSLMRTVISLALFALSLLVFAIWPGLDLTVSNWFYDPTLGFHLKKDAWAVRLYDVFGQIHWVILGGLLTILFFPQWLMTALRGPLRNRAAYLLIAMLLGPGLAVNSGFKEHWGRARPHQVQEFGGPQTYSPALQPAQACEGNCSFVSGHAAMGFFVVSVYFITRRRRWLVAGVLTGSVVGLARIVQGDHFLSDVVFAFWTVWFVSWAIAFLMGLRPRS
jgi:lipid A 4'-phosphatase